MQPNLAPSVPANKPAFIAPSVPLPPEPAPVADATTPLVLLGLDQSGKAHGARFVGPEAAVEQAADLMDFFLIRADTDTLREMAATLPKGRLFESGRAFAPFIKRALYERLFAAAGIIAKPRPVKAAGKPAEGGGSARGGDGRGAGGAGAGDPPATRVGAKAPADWSQVGIGSRVLAEASDEDGGGYWVAEVVATKADDALQLIWCGFDLPEFARPRRALALLHPDAVVAGE
jgi:hypothetical protein